MKRMVAVLALVSLAPLGSAQATRFTDDQARQIYAMLQSGRGACIVTRTVIVPPNNVEQTFCSCVANVNGTISGPSGEIEAIDVTLGPEQLCGTPPPGAGPTAQQRQDAVNRINAIDAELANLDAWMRNLDGQVNQWAYQNDPNYRAIVDDWKRQWADYARWLRGQLQAERNGLLTIANAPMPGAPPGAAPVPGGAPGDEGPEILDVPMGN